MYFDSLHAALTMEGHGFYVWMAYAVAVVVIVVVLIAPAFRSKRLLRQLAGELRRAQRSPGTHVPGER